MPFKEHSSLAYTFGKGQEALMSEILAYLRNECAAAWGFAKFELDPIMSRSQETSGCPNSTNGPAFIGLPGFVYGMLSRH